jgi:hypothetical protein
MLNTKIHLAVLTVGLLLSAGADAEGNPHWSKDGCRTCHMEAAPTDGLVNLNSPDAEALCDTCHGDRGDALPCRHASGLPVGEVIIPDQLLTSLKDGKVVCSTCHDIVFQCERPKIHFSFQNPGFLRDRTSHESSDYCSKCHDTSEYEKLSPHAGITGNPPRPTCLLCHSSFPETGSAGQLEVEFNMQHDLNDTCRGCHVVRPHPKSMSFGSSQSTEEWVHLVVPSAEVLENMRKAQAETGIGLPLNPLNGEVFCATCHNPHDFKLGGEHGSQERAIENRLRVNDICQACHDK